MTEIIAVQGSWSAEDRAWVSDVIPITGSIHLEVELPKKGRMVIKKSNTPEGPWPKALISPWTGPDFKIRIHRSYEQQYIKIYLTSTPITIQYAYI